MSIRFLCRNGQKTTVAKVYLAKMSLFRKYPELAKLDSYQLRCDADLDLLNLFLDKVYDESSVVAIDEINEDNFAELNSASLSSMMLCRLLKVSGRNWLRMIDSGPVGDVARGCEQRSSAVSRMTEQRIEVCAKQSNLDALTRVVEQLKQSDKEIRAHVKTITSATEGPTLADRIPLSSPKPVDPPATAKPAERSGIDFVYDDCNPLRGVVNAMETSTTKELLISQRAVFTTTVLITRRTRRILGQAHVTFPLATGTLGFATTSKSDA